MPSLLPALAKTWQIVPNVLIAADAQRANQFKAQVLGMKNQMKAFASSPWTVVGSSNGVAFSVNDGTDRWSSGAAVVISSWIILRQTGHGYNLDLLIFVSSNDLSNFPGFDIYISSGAGFTGGGATTRPTATDEVQITKVGGSVTTAATNTQSFQHMWQSTDGQCLRVIVYASNAPIMGLFLERLKNPIVELTKPWMAGFFVATGNSLLYANLFQAANWRGYHAGAISFQPSTEAVGATLLGQFAATQVANELSNSFIMSPVGAVCTTPPKRGRHGDLFDFWVGSTNILDGDTFPGSAESPQHQFVQCGNCVVLPWPQVVMSIA